MILPPLSCSHYRIVLSRFAKASNNLSTIPEKYDGKEKKN